MFDEEEYITSQSHERELEAIEKLNVKSLQASYAEVLKAIEETPDAHLVFKDDEKELIVALIDNYMASLAIGSENWCISSVRYHGGSPGQYYWNWYVGEKDRRQYFVWNFKHPSEDYRLIGTTTNETPETFYCAYNFPNMSFNVENYIKSVDGLDRSMFFKNDALRKNPSNV